MENPDKTIVDKVKEVAIERETKEFKFEPNEHTVLFAKYLTFVYIKQKMEPPKFTVHQLFHIEWAMELLNNHYAVLIENEERQKRGEKPIEGVEFEKIDYDKLRESEPETNIILEKVDENDN